MGLLQGKIEGRTFVITDSFSLPVSGTETRVNAGEEANEYMVQYMEYAEGTRFSGHPVVGWYHSHPGYGCWLSGVDVATQRLYQDHQEPFVAVVIDPVKTIEAGRVVMGAFRTLKSGEATTKRLRQDSKGVIPQEKIEDFGAHQKEYYSLSIDVTVSPSDRAILKLIETKGMPQDACSESPCILQKRPDLELIELSSLESLLDSVKDSSLSAKIDVLPQVNFLLRQCSCSLLRS